MTIGLQSEVTTISGSVSSHCSIDMTRIKDYDTNCRRIELVTSHEECANFYLSFSISASISVRRVNKEVRKNELRLRTHCGRAFGRHTENITAEKHIDLGDR